MSDPWLETTLGRVAEIVIGRQRSPSKSRGEHMTRYLRSANVKDGRLDLTDVLTMNFDVREQAQYALSPGDVLVSEGSASATQVGSNAVWHGELPGTVCFQNTLLRLRARRDVTEPDFLAVWASNAHRAGHFARIAGGSSILHIGSTRASSMRVKWPPMPSQRQIVDLIGAHDLNIKALTQEAEAVSRLHRDLLLSSLTPPLPETRRGTPLRECLRLDLDRVVVRADQLYHLVGVLNEGKGLIDRGELPGHSTAYTALNRLHAGQLVMRRLTAWEGPIAVVPPAFDGAYASAEFPTFTANPSRLAPQYLAHLCRWPGLWREMKQRVTGSVQRRKRLSPDQLLDVAVPLPPVEAQAVFADLLDKADDTMRALREEASALSRLRNALLRDVLEQRFDISDSHGAPLGPL